MKTAHRQAAHAKRYTRDPMAMFRVIGRAQSFTQDEQAQLNLPVRLAYESILKGQGMQEVIRTVEVYEQLTALLTAGQIEDALKECHQRMRAGDVMELGQ